MNYYRILITFLTIKALFMVGFILYSDIGLGPDEAQYWTWSQMLDWGYYSKPPGIAWEIWLGTKIFGNTVLGVRFFSVLFSFFITLSVYYLSLACDLDKKRAFWAGIIMAFIPLGMISSFFAITDVGMVLFWTLACIAYIRGPDYVLIGVLIAIGALFKWPIYLLWLFMRGSKMLKGVLISLLGLIPSMIWNWKNDWVTFRHVFTTISGGHHAEQGTTPLFQGNFFDFLGAQASLISPILFLLFVVAFVYWLKNPIPKPINFCAKVSFTILGAYLFISIFKKMQGNWCVFAYPTGVVYLAWYGCEKRPIFMKVGLFFSILLCIILLSPFPGKFTLFRHNLGWNQMKNELNELGYDPQKHFLFGDKYQMSSLLSFYSPGQKRAYFLNLHSSRKNQFSYWPSMKDEQLGKTGYFVLAENYPRLKELVKKKDYYLRILPEYFEKVEYLGIKPLYGKGKKEAIFIKGVGYNGKVPENSDKF